MIDIFKSFNEIQRKLFKPILISTCISTYFRSFKLKNEWVLSNKEEINEIKEQT